MVTNSEKGPNEEEHMISTVSFIRRRVARPRGVLMGLGALAGAAALVLAGTTSATATPRGAMAQAKAELAQGPRAETVSSLDLQSFVAKTTSTTGVKLYVSFDASNVIGFPKYDSADVILDNLNSSEGHLWSFPIGKRAFVPKSSGAGSFRTGSAFGAYGSVAVTFTPTASKRIEVCNATNYVRDQTERVRGTFFFDSHSTGRHAWGKVGSKTKAFSFKGQTNLFTGYSSGLCTPKTSVGACYSQVSWSATTVTDKPQSKSVTFSGSVGDGPTDMDATREVNLSAPKRAQRFDFVYGKEPAPVLTTSGQAGTVKVTTAGGSFGGSGTIKSSDGMVQKPTKCKTGTLKETEWNVATFTPGASTLRAREQIFGTISLPAGKWAATMDSIKG
jgi:hypothetical protein